MNYVKELLNKHIEPLIKLAQAGKDQEKEEAQTNLEQVRSALNVIQAIEEANKVDATQTGKKMYISYAPEGAQSVTTSIEDFLTGLGYAEDGEEYSVKKVYMTEEEYKALPEWTGF